MLEMISDYYMPVLAVVCVVYMNRFMNKQLILAFVFSFFYVYSLGFMEARFGWWAAMDGVFNSDIAAVVVMVCALMSVSYRIGGIALLSFIFFGATLINLQISTWFDILSSTVAGVPCWILFSSAKKESDDSTLES